MVYLLIFREPVSAWTHFAWLVLSVPGTAVLLRLTRGDRVKQATLGIFGMALALCYGASALYHGVRLGHRAIEIFETLDQIGIYFLIAGSYTPASFILLRGPWKWGSLALVWALAAAGITLRVVYGGLPPPLATGLYLLLGWGIILAYFKMARSIGHRALFPVVLGGIFYSTGAVLNVLGGSVLCFTAHEFMHLCVMAGSLAHYWFMVYAIVPFNRLAAAADWSTKLVTALPVLNSSPAPVGSAG